MTSGNDGSGGRKSIRVGPGQAEPCEVFRALTASASSLQNLVGML